MTKRFENAVMKLYDAFHKGELKYSSCEKCAVGNIVGHSRWFFSSPSLIWGGIIRPHNKMHMWNNNSGYSISELAKVEHIFIMAFEEVRDSSHKESQFKGLCAVVEYLCELDNIPNVMDYKWLFESEENKPEKVFSHEYN